MFEWIELNMTPGVGPRVAARLLERFGSAERAMLALRAELEPLRLQAETIESIIKRDKRDAAQSELENVRSLGGDVLVIDDGNYPALLREIPDSPLTFYVKGAWETSLNAPCVALVGSRRCSTYGINASMMLGRDLAANGVTVISGLARGIDAAAHRGALEAGGRTVAVMGTGLDEVYPKEHRKLVDEILEKGGAIVTEFPLSTPPQPQNFPFRNRIISGLSLGVVLIEATERSGSLITARLAMEQNREVYAVPGNITSRTSIGTNYLIKAASAKLVQAWQDIVQEFPPDIAARILPPQLETETATTDTKDLSTLTQTSNTKAQTPGGLSDNETKVWRTLVFDTATHIDELAVATDLPIAQLTAALIGLEMRELIRSLPGSCYARKL